MQPRCILGNATYKQLAFFTCVSSLFTNLLSLRKRLHLRLGLELLYGGKVNKKTENDGDTKRKMDAGNMSFNRVIMI